jgi:hypothetical protein
MISGSTRRCALVIILSTLSVLPVAGQQRRTKAPAKPAPKTRAEPAPAVRTEHPVPFHVGETLSYDVGWSGYLTAGTATITVQQKRPSYASTAYYVVAEGRPTPLLSKLYAFYYKVDTLLDVYALLPQRGSVYEEEGKRHRTKATIFDQDAKKAQYEVTTGTVVKKEMVIPASTQDALSALYVLRSLPLKAGDRFNMPVSDSGVVYKVQMTAGSVEPVQTPMGTIRAIKVTPAILDSKDGAPSRGMAIWFSDDARRLPVRLETQLAVGKFTLTLRQASGS